jgi:hypothetical protein
MANPGRTGSLPTPAQKTCRRPGPSHAERLLDEALEETFPASDPIAAHLAEESSDALVEQQHVERELDIALELTFPASDPIAISTFHPCIGPDIEPPAQAA